jgi:hypothetical protein
VAALVAAQEQLPKRLRDFFIDYRASLADDVVSDRAFEFRVEIMQKRAPKSEADLAVEFVQLNELTTAERKAYEQVEKTGRVILRDKLRDVANAGWMKPGPTSKAVQERLGWRFMASAEFPKAWQHFNVRPPNTATGVDRARTDPRYCRYDTAFESYVYSGAFVELVVEACSTEEGFEAIVGWPPKPIPPVAP